jgi:hypothetical protein
MAGLDDLSVEELEKLIKKKKSGKSYKVREFTVDEGDFRRLLGIGPDDKDDDSDDDDDDDDDDGKGKKKGYFS